MNPLEPLPASERQLLLALARAAIRGALGDGPPPEPDGCRLPPRLMQCQACFVTLTRDGDLRGCIGNLEPRQPLWRAVRENAVAAALRDHRFARVTLEELEGLEIEISLLTPPRPVAAATPAERLALLRPGRDGVLLEVGGHRATFLPQVWEKLREPRQFLRQLCLKAGAEAEAWERPDARLSCYEVEHFGEVEPPEAGA